MILYSVTTQQLCFHGECVVLVTGLFIKLFTVPVTASLVSLWCILQFLWLLHWSLYEVYFTVPVTASLVSLWCTLQFLWLLHNNLSFMTSFTVPVMASYQLIFTVPVIASQLNVIYSSRDCFTTTWRHLQFPWLLHNNLTSFTVPVIASQQLDVISSSRDCFTTTWRHLQFPWLLHNLPFMTSFTIASYQLLFTVPVISSH